MAFRHVLEIDDVFTSILEFLDESAVFILVNRVFNQMAKLYPLKLKSRTKRLAERVLKKYRFESLILPLEKDLRISEIGSCGKHLKYLLVANNHNLNSSLFRLLPNLETFIFRGDFPFTFREGDISSMANIRKLELKTVSIGTKHLNMIGKASRLSHLIIEENRKKIKVGPWIQNLIEIEYYSPIEDDIHYGGRELEVLKWYEGTFPQKCEKRFPHLQEFVVKGSVNTLIKLYGHSDDQKVELGNRIYSLYNSLGTLYGVFEDFRESLSPPID